jgi:hypothetical protein
VTIHAVIMPVQPFRKLVPEDNGREKRAEARALWRSCAAMTLARVHGERPVEFTKRAFPDDDRAARIVKGAVNPTDTSSASALSISKTGPLLMIAPQSAAARLFEKCARFDLSGVATISVPYAVAHPTGIFVAESSPIPVAQGALGAATVGPTRKLSFIVVISRELDEASPENASTVISRLMGESAARSLDAVVFDANAADTTRPAGLLHNVTPITGTASGAPTADLIAGDIGKLAQAFSDANINSENMVLVTSTSAFWKYQLTRGFAELPAPCIPSMSVPVGTVIAIAIEGVGSAYSGMPEIEIVKQPAVHFESATPQQIGTSPNIVAAPTRSLWQQDLLGIKLRQRAAWAVLQPGSVQVITNANW